MKKIAIIGGGAAGMACAVHLARAGAEVAVLERNDRLGRKLSATGNGQGNVSNEDLSAAHYFSDDREKVARMLARFGSADTVRFLEGMGGVFLPDARGRIYPAGRQASAIADLFRTELAKLNAGICLGTQVRKLTFDGVFTLEWEDGHMRADAVVLAAGGKAAPNFGTDGTAYALAQSFGHALTPLSPALVRLKSDPALVRGLKGIRMAAALKVLRKGIVCFEGRGDVLFTENGVSGDLVFRASSHAKEGDVLEIDFLPDVTEERLEIALKRSGDSLLCIVPNGLGRALSKRANGRHGTLVSLLKHFMLPVLGDCGFANAQVTKGGIPLAETDENLQSIKRNGLFFAGEILNADGECGGYNLQWAFTSAFVAAEGALAC